MSGLLNNIDPNLLEENPRIVVNMISDNLVSTATDVRSKTVGVAKDIEGFYSLVEESVRHSESVGGTSEESKVDFTRDYSLSEFTNEIMTYKLLKREPGDFSQGPPFGGTVKNYKPKLREEIEDPDNPTYKKLIFGYWHDNLVEFTCFARTNKEADDRALWIENLMNNYLWFFRYSGVNRVLYFGRGTETSEKFDGYTIHGRSIKYFVRTEDIVTVSEKEIEQIALNYSIT